MRAHLKQVQDANNGSLSRYKAREAEEERDTIELSAGQARLGLSASRHSHRLHEMPVSGKGERQSEREREGGRVCPARRGHRIVASMALVVY